MDDKVQNSASECPYPHTTPRQRSNRDWWPDQLNLKILHQNSPSSDPLDETFDYREELRSSTTKR